MAKFPIGRNGELYVVIQFFFLFLIIFVPSKILPIWPEPLLTAAVVSGSLLIALSVLFLGSGIIQLGKNLRAVPKPKHRGRLVTSGMYRVVRHPIYTGLLFGSAGLGLIRTGEITLLLTIALFLLLLLKIEREERWLWEQYPEYSAYSRRVKKIIPFLY